MSIQNDIYIFIGLFLFAANFKVDTLLIITLTVNINKIIMLVKLIYIINTERIEY